MCSCHFYLKNQNVQTMIDRLNLIEIVRYLFSGILAVFSVFLANGLTFYEMEVFIKDHSWIKESGPAAIIVVLTLLTGYIAFGYYRNFVYEFLIVELKAAITKLCRMNTYREFINKICIEQKLKRKGNRSIERIYAIIKNLHLNKFYNDTGSIISTNLHLLYFASIVILISSIFAYLWLYSLIALISLILVIIMDFHFEKLEFLLIQTNQKEIRDTISKIKDN